MKNVKWAYRAPLIRLGLIKMNFLQSSERLIDGRKTPDYALYSELFTPELARQIVLGKEGRKKKFFS